MRPHWSPDGTKLVFERSSGDTFQLMIGSVTGGPVTGIGPTRPDKTGGADVQFSPDGTRLMAYYNADRTSWLLDPGGGPGTQLAYERHLAPHLAASGALKPGATMRCGRPPLVAGRIRSRCAATIGPWPTVSP